MCIYAIISALSLAGQLEKLQNRELVCAPLYTTTWEIFVICSFALYPTITAATNDHFHCLMCQLFFD